MRQKIASKSKYITEQKEALDLKCGLSEGGWKENGSREIKKKKKNLHEFN